MIGRLRFALVRSRTSSREAVFQPQDVLCGIRPAVDKRVSFCFGRCCVCSRSEIGSELGDGQRGSGKVGPPVQVRQ